MAQQRNNRSAAKTHLDVPPKRAARKDDEKTAARPVDRQVNIAAAYTPPPSAAAATPALRPRMPAFHHPNALWRDLYLTKKVSRRSIAKIETVIVSLTDTLIYRYQVDASPLEIDLCQAGHWALDSFKASPLGIGAAAPGSTVYVLRPYLSHLLFTMHCLKKDCGVKLLLSSKFSRQKTARLVGAMLRNLDHVPPSLFDRIYTKEDMSSRRKNRLWRWCRENNGKRRSTLIVESKPLRYRLKDRMSGYGVWQMPVSNQSKYWNDYGIGKVSNFLTMVYREKTDGGHKNGKRGRKAGRRRKQ